MPDGPFALPLAALAAVLADRLLGEPRRFHPLVGFGWLASALELWLNSRLNKRTIAAGLLAWLLAVGPWIALAFWLRPLAPFAVDAVLLWFALGAQSLGEHAEAVARPLREGRLDEARQRVSWMVSRDTATLEESGVAKAGVESVLENGNDAVFGALFWFAVLGGPGALLFRLANTLDAMWGYRSERFNRFGRCAARLDDVLNWLPARLTALTYALLGRTRCALACWRTQAAAWESPNAGPVMAAGAGGLGVQLGGAAIYYGREEMRPPLGAGRPPLAADLGRAVALVRHGLWLWLAIFFLTGLLHA
ncbi:MAG: adenosylcobinamide-phosphate synthase CbiB [Azonexus sp.]|uniref:adenosylcobinamide-phosphate synthase CbiB n=1 Tax=Azonexus sp. TaxID=1872668 RepID=UPI00282DD799|nr:adenosylcobinamide-phosphate synthase CbiB [Azonexus sp.]MDR0777460.1 adenosylcobinamide-phosphate synthase CbiB [Azonexus sp.]